MNFGEWLALCETIIVNGQEFRSPLQALKHMYETHPNPENLIVTFTRWDKVGINPKSHFSPVGVYFYPLDYVIKEELQVPFAGQQPYLNVCEFTRPEKILHMTKDKSNQKGMELLSVFPKESVDIALNIVEDKLMNRDPVVKILSDYSKFWLIVKQISQHNPVTVNVNFRKCGIDGFVDHGTQTICGDEPTQGVVLTGTSLKRILVVPYYHPRSMKTGVKYLRPIRKEISDITKIPKEQIENLLKHRNSDLEIYDFIKDSSNKDETIDLIIRYKKDLSSSNVLNILIYASDREEIAKSLGSYNINKLNYRHAFNFIKLKSSDVNERIQFLRNYYTGTDPEIISLLSQQNVL